ncbi:hypothetical protein [Neisseria zalophi]|uniref:Uncharacterized protein n=1 Tax=Neisseria zalophi TaxID=640030 RepID=A0A5J6PZA0_9NEIS|nr:hypothetical protein [Neisseria zalophi]QEY26187.1 hypothetical protein D0T92_06390 [Neisseria zalophi]
MSSVHDKEIVGVFHHKENKTLTIQLSNGESIVYKNIIFFLIKNLSDQNIIFDIYYFDNKNIPDDIIENFPSLLSFKNSNENYEISYIHSSVGMEGVVVSYYLN